MIQKRIERSLFKMMRSRRLLYTFMHRNKESELSILSGKLRSVMKIQSTLIIMNMMKVSSLGGLRSIARSSRASA